MKALSLPLWLSLCLFACAGSVNAAQTDIIGPAGSGAFGNSVTVLPNGNIVVTDPLYDIPAGAADVGAVYLYDGATLALISTLTGGTAGDSVGDGGITVLTNGNFVVRSQNWDNISPVAANAGAVTWCSQTTGCSGTVSAANSLVGGTLNDNVGFHGVTPLTNGNYVVRSANWDNPSPVAANAGAVTWGNGTSGTSGLVTSANSLVGGTASDQVGSDVVTALTNGNYVVGSSFWDNTSPAAIDAGAVTWGNGTSGISGSVTSANSLVGGTASDFVGLSGVTALTNGNYVVSSGNWDNPSPAAVDAGAVTWGNGSTGISGSVTSANSLVGGTANDNVGAAVTALTNGNYVVRSVNWDNPSPVITNVGAATWGNGSTGISGLVTSANSLIGGTASDQVGSVGVTALTNGNYVVISQNWDNTSPSTVAAGAVTWGNGTSGTSGLVTSANSLVGGTANDNVGANGVRALTNGNYVVRSQNWDNPSPVTADVGAVTWGNGTSGTSGLVTSANSLVGGTASDLVGSSGITVLTNGNYVVGSSFWDNPSPAVPNAGAATWGNGTSGTSGSITSANSLIGGTINDSVSSLGITALTNGNYVVISQNWDNTSPLTVAAGAVTWGNGTSGTSGLVTSANSLVGGTANDNVGNNAVTALTNGNYVVRSSSWDNTSPVTSSAGAITLGNGITGTSGLVTSANSLVGGTASDSVSGGAIATFANGNYFVRSINWDNPSPAVTNASAVTFGNGASGMSGFVSSTNSVVGTVTSGTNTSAFDATRNRLFVGRSASNIVSVIFFTTTAIADGDLSNAANWDNGVPNGLVSGIIPTGRTMSISSVMNIGQIRVECGGNLTGGSSTAYVVGSVRRDFCGAAGASFTFPIGDPGNYSPLNVTNVNGTGDLTVSAIDTFMPGLRATTSSLSRYWSLSGSGITADLTFNYTNADVNGNEASYLIFRRPVENDSLVSRHSLSSVNAAANTATAYNVSSFSDWGLAAQPLAPTAAQVSVSGRVLTSNGSGVRNAIVQLTDMQGITRTVRTSSFGYYQFDDIDAGQTVTIAVASKRFTFTPRVVTVTDNIGDLDLVALTE